MDKRRQGNSTMSAKNHASLFQQIMEYDSQLSRKLCICSSSDVGFFTGSPTRKMLLLCEYSGHGVLWLVIVAALLYHYWHDAVFRPFYQNVMAAWWLDLAVIIVMKMTFRRDRPATNKDDMYLTGYVDKHSFPSGHATRASIMACVFLQYSFFNDVHKTLIILWAALVCISRVLSGRHHVIDVLCGIAIGILQFQFMKSYMWFT